MDGYPQYRRRAPVEGGVTFTIRKEDAEITLDNRWVVPHNPLLPKSPRRNEAVGGPGSSLPQVGPRARLPPTVGHGQRTTK